ncbi:MAG: hypothetical protein H6818_03195 [Phycisphaerales bacterium]|nr:hypothetical protein [Phycisphaerales bacterium]
MMANSRRLMWFVTVATMMSAIEARAADYRTIPMSVEAHPGDVVAMRVEVETLPGDNLIGVGHYSFAINLEMMGLPASAVSNVDVNQVLFDDVNAVFVGAPIAGTYEGIAGASTDVFPPNPGSQAGDIITLFTFNLLIPEMAIPGELIHVQPVEGDLANVSASFVQVSPQTFAGTSLIVVPEPAGATFMIIAGFALRGPRRLGHS